jgi:hypothetical protein
MYNRGVGLLLSVFLGATVVTSPAVAYDQCVGDEIGEPVVYEGDLQQS